MRHSRPGPKYQKTAPLLLTISSLLLVGVFTIYNSTVFYSQSVYGSAYQFFFLHLGWVFLGLVGFLFFYMIHYKEWIRLSSFLFGVALCLLFIPALFGLLTFQFGVLSCEASRAFVPCINGAYRWLHLNSQPLPPIPFLGVLSLQPAEFAKLSLVIFISALLSRDLGRFRGDSGSLFTTFLIPTALISGLIILQPNMSTASLIFFISLVIYFGSGAPLRPLYILMPVLATLLFVFILLSPYRRARFNTLFLKEASEDIALSSGYHTRQVLISLGSGGTFGLGIGQSRQKYHYLPEVASDSIFAIIGEELGFVGTVSFVLLYSYFLYQGFSIAGGAPDTFSRCLALGVTSWLGLQFFINVAAMVQIIPLTGVPIPLVSYGGSSLFFVMCGLGLLANVSKYSFE